VRRAADPEWAAAFLPALGDELRRARLRHRWTRNELRARLGLSLSPHTLATYEQGSRSIAVLRLVELARVLEVPVLDLLAAALQRAGRADDGLRLDLTAAASIRDGRLGPLRRWARCRLDSVRAGQPTVIPVGPAAVSYLAELCGMTTGDLTNQLDQVLP
jgi:transcriptional regulator with XRE-family HTH domain